MQELSSVFQTLKNFITQQMRMSHLYQPLMLKVLIERNGFAPLREIASRFLAHDESQIEYYVEITKRMPGPVLTRQPLVRREGEGYRLIPDVQVLTSDERGELLRLCDEAVANYSGRRGRKLYDHRRVALGDISGTARYEVLRRAGFRCDLCGISAEERALEVDLRLLKRASFPTSSAPIRDWTRLANAASISRSLLAFNICTCSPRAGAAACTSLAVSSDAGLFGFSRKPIVAMPGTKSCNSASTFAPSSPTNALKPVRLPPGRLRLATSPSCTGSVATLNTIGMLVVAALAARAVSTPAATITATRS
jgi:hypothetical protein